MPQPNSPAGDRWMFAIPAGLALMLLGLAAMLVAIERYGDARARAMQSWPSTAGTITGSGVRQQPQQDGYWNLYDDTGVRYTVGGHTYNFTNSVYVGRRHSQADNGTPKLAYKANDPVRVFYDPANPADGSLTNAAPNPGKVVALLAWLLAVLSLPVWFIAARMFWTSRRKAR